MFEIDSGLEPRFDVDGRFDGYTRGPVRAWMVFGPVRMRVPVAMLRLLLRKRN